MAITSLDLTGRVAMITGGRRGIGRGIAQRLAAAGAAVVLTSEFEDEEGLNESLQLIRSAGGRATALSFDLAIAEQRAGVIDTASRAFGPIDILVNNAAVRNPVAPSVMGLEDRRIMFEVNVQGPIDLIQQALPHMCAQRWGHILNITSETVRERPIPYPTPASHVYGLVLYGASKAALERYTVGLAAELHGTGVHVNSLYPYRVCVADDKPTSDSALAGLAAHPDWAEPVEMMAEAALLLIAGGLTGVSKNSREILQMFQQPLRARDGRTVIGDAHTLVTLA